MQAKGRTVRLGQTKECTILAPYMRGSIDEDHRLKHIHKIDLSVRVCGDSQSDNLYSSIEPTQWDALDDLDN